MTRLPTDAPLIIWDFDGTLYPLCPYDSEQILLRLRVQQLRGMHWLPRKGIMRAVVHADQQQWFSNGSLRKLYRHAYGWCLKGASKPLLDRAAAAVAATISNGDREALRHLYAAGWRMVVVSCGTLDLCERVLEIAGIRDCFESTHANRLIFRDGLVAGEISSLVSAEDKLRLAKKLARGRWRSVVAVGDGYTDIPLLDWVGMPVMIDSNGSKKSAYARSKPYHFVSSIHAVRALLTDVHGGRMERDR